MVRAEAANLDSRAAVAFALFAALFIVAAATITRTELDEVLRWAITFDVAVTLPFLYYFAVVRRTGVPLLSLVPVIVLTQIGARVFIHGDPSLLANLGLLLLPMEIAILGWIGIRVGRAVAASEGDVATRIREISARTIPHPRIAAILSSELTLLWYGIAGWRMESAPATNRSTTFHRGPGWDSIVLGVIVMIIAEGIGVHLLLLGWSPVIAWIVTVIHVWSIFWIVGDYQALRTIPSTVRGDRLILRLGLRWSGETDLANVARITPGPPADPGRRHVSFALVDENGVTVYFVEPVQLEGLFGMRRTVDSILFLPDDPRFVDLLKPEPHDTGQPQTSRT